MKLVLALFLAFIFFSPCAQGQNNSKHQILPIYENGKWGFINPKGELKIKAKFHVIGAFAEGLAPVRESAYYGYIDTNGIYSIEAQFDYAESFNNGMAKVFRNGKAYFINRQGETIFQHDNLSYQGFNDHGLCIVSSPSHHFGIVNRKGQFVLDTIYSNISEFSEGFAVAIKEIPGEGTKSKFQYALINSRGEIKIPFGKYATLSEVSEGLLTAELYVEEHKDFAKHRVVLDTSGRIQFTVPGKEWYFSNISYDFKNGLRPVKIFELNPDEHPVSEVYNHTHLGLINTKGKIVAENKAWGLISTFHKNRAFVRDSAWQWFLIDTAGNYLNESPYQMVLNFNYGSELLPFANDWELVKTKEGWQRINLNGEGIGAPIDSNWSDRNLQKQGDILVINQSDGSRENHYKRLFGYWDFKRNIYLKPQFDNLKIPRNGDSPYYAEQEGRMMYISPQGNIIWQASELDTSQLLDFNIDYMNRGYFYASSPYKEELAGSGGWGGSRNGFQKIKDSKRFKNAKLSLEVYSEPGLKYEDIYKGQSLILANPSEDSIFFDAQDSRLYLKIQALDRSGEWKDIEYLPSSWCGNSYHTVFLAPHNYWHFSIPKYQGAFITRFRAEVKYKSSPEAESQTLYSNEFEGSINPGQFWRKTDYSPQGLMDPYFD